MTNSRVLLAVAGSGKTESIIRDCAETYKRRLVISYTTNGQREIESRLRAAKAFGTINELPDVVGWYKFLLDHFLKPYLPVSEFSRTYQGFNKTYDPGPRAQRDRRYFDREGQVGGELLGYVAAKVQKSTTGLPVKRLEKIYEEIIIDEVQDLVASDLVILEELLKSSISIRMVGDPRQTVFETNRSDRKYSKFRGIEKVKWFIENSKKGLFSLTEQTTNYRCCSAIVDLANQVFNPGLGLENATSGQLITHPHQGVFYITEDEVDDYVSRFSPMPLRLNKRSAKKWNDDLQFTNFGEAKGLQADHVLIFPTAPIKTFLESRSPIDSPQSAARLYVAITRARHSVAFVMPKSSRPGAGISWWNAAASPNG